MIVISVDLDAATGPQNDAHLFTMVIGNDGTGTPQRGNYNVYLGRRGVSDPFAVIRKPLRKGRVENHPRLSTHAGSLVAKALKAVKL